MDHDEEIPEWLKDPEATPVIPPPKPGIQQLRQPSKFTCLPTAFAMVLAKGHPTPVLLLGDILHQLGRDDERGFHVQELLGIAATLKIPFMPFETRPDLERAKCMDEECYRGRINRPLHGYDMECPRCAGSGDEPLPPMVLWPLEEILKQHDGVLVGTVNDRYHAVAWCYETQRCIDPDGPIYGIEDFKPDIFWAAFRRDADW